MATILSHRAVMTLVLREITSAGGTITTGHLRTRLREAGVPDDKTRSAIDYLKKIGRVVKISDDYRIPTRDASQEVRL